MKTFRRSMKSLINKCLLASITSMFSFGAHAFPEKPVKIIVPYAPGGNADNIARLLSKQLANIWSQPVVVENKPGNANIVGVQALLSAPRDGHTLLLCNTILATNESLYKEKLPYASNEIAPITQMVITPYAILVPPTMADNLESLFSKVKTEPGKFNFASLGPASTSNMLTRKLLRQHDLDMVEIPYKGAAAASIGLMSGESHFYLDATTSALVQHRGGKLKILGITSGKRLDAAPDIPTVNEQGINLEAASWNGICTGVQTPVSTQQAIFDGITEAISTDDFQDAIKATGALVMPSNSIEEFARFMKDEAVLWDEIIRPLKLELY